MGGSCLGVLLAKAHLGQTLGAGSVASLQGLMLPVTVREHFLLQRRSLLDGFFQGYVIRLASLLLGTFLTESCADLLHQAFVLVKLEFQLIQQSLRGNYEVSETAPRLRVSFESNPPEVASKSVTRYYSLSLTAIRRTVIAVQVCYT